MGTVAMYKSCLHALELMLDDNLTAEDEYRLTVRVVNNASGLKALRNLPQSTAKKLVHELKVPYHMATACSRFAHSCPWSDAAHAAVSAFSAFLTPGIVHGEALLKGSSSLRAAVQNQIQQSGLLQHLAALLEAAAHHAGAAGEAAVSKGTATGSPECAVANGGGSSSSSSSNSSSSSSRGHGTGPAHTSGAGSSHSHRLVASLTTRHVANCCSMAATLLLDAPEEQLAPHLWRLAASALHLALVAQQEGSRQVQQLRQRQQQQQQEQQQQQQLWEMGEDEIQQMAMLCMLLVSSYRLIHAVVRALCMCFPFEGALQQLPGAELLLHSPHTLPCLAAAFTTVCAALRQQDTAARICSHHDLDQAAAFWQQSCTLADSHRAAEHWLQQLTGLEPQAIQLSAVLTADSADPTHVYYDLLLYHNIIIALEGLPSTPLQSAQTPGIMQLPQCKLLAGLVVLQFGAAVVPQAAADMLRHCGSTASLCSSGLSECHQESVPVMQPGNLQPTAAQQQQDEQVAGLVDALLPPLLSTLTSLQQRLQHTAAGAAGADGASRDAALVAYGQFASLMGELVLFAVRYMQREPEEAAAGAAASPHADDAPGSSTQPSSPAVSPQDQAAEWAMQLEHHRGKLWLPTVLCSHVAQILAAVQSLVRVAASGAGIDCYMRSALTCVKMVGVKAWQHRYVMGLLSVAGNDRSEAEQQLQGLLLSMLKLSAAAVSLTAPVGVADGVRLFLDVALCSAEAQLKSWADDLEQAGHLGGGRPAVQHTAAALAAAKTEAAAAAAAEPCAEPSAVSTSGSGADPRSMLPYLVVFGRWCLQCGEQLQQQLQEGMPAVPAGDPAAEGVPHRHTSTVCESLQPGKALRGCEAACQWLRAGSHAAQLEVAGYDITSLLQQLEEAADAASESVIQQAAGEQLLPLVPLLMGVGQALCCLAMTQACNNPGCSNVSGPSEQQLVSGRSCICAGCRTARYCSRACQKQHWKQHKAVCKALAAACSTATAAAAACSTATAAAAAEQPCDEREV